MNHLIVRNFQEEAETASIDGQQIIKIITGLVAIQDWRDQKLMVNLLEVALVLEL